MARRPATTGSGLTFVVQCVAHQRVAQANYYQATTYLVLVRLALPAVMVGMLVMLVLCVYVCSYQAE